MKLVDKFKSIVKEVTKLDRTPKDMAIALSLGVFIAISPYLGLHTVLAILLSTYLKLPIYAIFLGTCVNNFLTLPFIYTFATKFGIWLLHMNIDVHAKWSHVTVMELVKTGEELLLPFFVGTNLLGLISAIITYFISYAAFSLYKSRKIKSQTP